MSRKKVLSILFCIPLFFSFSSKSFFSFILRVGLVYVGYQLVDGVSDGVVSSIVDRYKNGPIDVICSFGEGVKRFGNGVRKVSIDFWKDDNADALNSLWNGLKVEYNNAFGVAKKEWTVRRKKLAAQKLKSECADKNVLVANKENKDSGKDKSPSIAI